MYTRDFQGKRAGAGSGRCNTISTEWVGVVLCLSRIGRRFGVSEVRMSGGRWAGVDDGW